MNQVKYYFNKIVLTSRPLLWLTHFCSFFFGISQLNLDNINLFKIVLCVFCLGWPVSMYIYGINDITDYETDILNDRKGGLLGLKHNKSDFALIRNFSIIAGIIFFIVSLLGNWITILIALIFLFFLGFYSLKPIRFKNIPFVDSVIGGGMYSLLLTLWSFSLLGGNFDISTISLNPFIFMFSVGFTLQSIGSVIDYDSDLKSGNRSSATFFGCNIVAIYTAAINIIALLLIQNNNVLKIFLLLFSLFSLLFLSKLIRTNYNIKQFLSIAGIVGSFILTLIVFIIIPDIMY